MQKSGDRLDQPRDVDFFFLFVSEKKATAFLNSAAASGYKKSDYEEVDGTEFEQDFSWDVRIQVFMVPTHADITKTELALTALAAKFGGEPDGWGAEHVG